MLHDNFEYDVGTLTKKWGSKQRNNF